MEGLSELIGGSASPAAAIGAGSAAGAASGAATAAASGAAVAAGAASGAGSSASAAPCRSAAAIATRNARETTAEELDFMVTPGAGKEEDAAPAVTSPT